jgi:pantetheine-phosphate adenylyltransferase
MYRHLAPDVEVVCLMTSSSNSFISSSFIREVASLGGDISSLVPPQAAAALSARFADGADGSVNGNRLLSLQGGI